MPEVIFSYAIRSHHSEARDNNSSLHATVTLLLHRWHLLRILRTGLIGVIGLPWLVVRLLWLVALSIRLLWLPLPWLVVRLLWLVVGGLLLFVLGRMLVLWGETLLPLIAPVLHRIPFFLRSPQRNIP